MNPIGVVVIGRNEGERLRSCLMPVVAPSAPPPPEATRAATPGPASCARAVALPKSDLHLAGVVVYVDSGSTDGSVAFARSLGVEVIELDMSIPFTAARARNAGVERLLQRDPAVGFVQFVDGDCEVVAGWLEAGLGALTARADVAAVAGRLRERFRDKTLYNRLCDLEWDTPLGETDACGGIVLMRVRAFREVGGFNASLIAGEEPELCFRLRSSGWKILRLDADMALHDAAMTRFSQAWRRAVRAGHAYAEGAWLHGRAPARHYVYDNVKILVWGLLLPTFIAGAARPTHGLAFVLVAAYPIAIARLARHYRRRGFTRPDAWLFGAFCVLSRFPQLVGLFRFYGAKLLGRRSRLIEYK